METIYFCEQGDPYCVYPNCKCNTHQPKKSESMSKPMLVGDLIEYLQTLDPTMIVAIRSKDDYLLTPNKVYVSDGAYFGNCYDGMEWESANATYNDDGELDTYDCLIFDSCD